MLIVLIITGSILLLTLSSWLWLWLNTPDNGRYHAPGDSGKRWDNWR